MSSSSPIISAAITTSSKCSSPPITSSHDHHLLNHIHSLSFFPHYSKPKPVIIKLNCGIPFNLCNYSSFSTHCTISPENGVLHQEDEEEEVAVEGEEKAGDDVAQSAEDGGRLYVGNLPFTMTSNQLSEIFAEAGRVVSVEIVYNRVTDRSRGFAFVTMATVDEAKEAIRLFDGALIGGRTAKVNFPEVPRGGEREVLRPKISNNNQGGYIDSPHKIYAGNLSWSLTSQGLREAFEGQEGFLGAKVIYERESGRSRGFGFITFSSRREMELALDALNGVELQGRPLRLSFSEQKLDAEVDRRGEVLSGVSTG